MAIPGTRFYNGKWGKVKKKITGAFFKAAELNDSEIWSEFARSTPFNTIQKRWIDLVSTVLYKQQSNTHYYETEEVLDLCFELLSLMVADPEHQPTPIRKFWKSIESEFHGHTSAESRGDTLTNLIKNCCSDLRPILDKDNFALQMGIPVSANRMEEYGLIDRAINEVLDLASKNTLTPFLTPDVASEVALIEKHLLLQKLKTDNRYLLKIVTSYGQVTPGFLLTRTGAKRSEKHHKQQIFHPDKFSKLEEAYLSLRELQAMEAHFVNGTDDYTLDFADISIYSAPNEDDVTDLKSGQDIHHQQQTLSLIMALAAVAIREHPGPLSYFFEPKYQAFSQEALTAAYLNKPTEQLNQLALQILKEHSELLQQGLNKYYCTYEDACHLISTCLPDKLHALLKELLSAQTLQLQQHAFDEEVLNIIFASPGKKALNTFDAETVLREFVNQLDPHLLILYQERMGEYDFGAHQNLADKLRSGAKGNQITPTSLANVLPFSGPTVKTRITELEGLIKQGNDMIQNNKVEDLPLLQAALEKFLLNWQKKIRAKVVSISGGQHAKI